MTCYLLFKEPMKYLVPRGSGRPILRVVPASVLQSQVWILQVQERCPRKWPLRLCAPPPPPPWICPCSGGVLRISSDGNDRRIFLGLKFLIPGYFWVGKSGKYFFGWLDLVGIFWGITDLGKVFLDVSSIVKPDEGKIIQMIL